MAGEDCGTSRNRRVSIPEAEAMMYEDDDDRGGQQRDPIWICWSNAMHALRVGDTDSAFAEVLSTGDDHLLVKLMDKTGPVLDQLSSDIGNEAIHSIAQFLLDHTLFDICLSWIQQVTRFFFSFQDFMFQFNSIVMLISLFIYYPATGSNCRKWSRLYGNTIGVEEGASVEST